MNKLLFLMMCGIFSFSSFAYNNGNGGTTNLGPIVECKMPSGDVTNIPSEMCRFRGGEWE
ncbi:hypothetical protein K08M3_07930 [Vibrio alginolyticus]|uniref:Uncharacterized protein n=1 Tax=Vibrio alginolyticus TaxID=663 RepID=A0A1W6U3T0_VIBAL|nr:MULTISPECIES: hypothetical protein [Vibrio]MDW2295272.1 hypothetical protein [Vibrio sp. 1404]QCO85316.1 hypothetical protein D3H41_04110 [Vibrio neocaledonicus]ARO97769.1 hypothetical protein K01M1_08140 [Vibrio alginolyticus]ARP02485.1 hypothetical protein K04M1_08250 [Vibrio alginolyticus]ARP07518.1 hypothetical protein K04M3_07920 [Vibrio alginolyticus]